MRLTFSTNDHMNTNVSNDRGHIYYNISTPSASKKVTTITRYRWSGQNSVPETMGVIEWHRLSQTMFQFNGDMIPVDALFGHRAWSTGRYFLGPDGQKYKWKLESTYVWMKPADSGTELVRYHKKNLGIWKDAHPAYLDVSSNVVSMLDHIILTFVYVEWLRQKTQAERRTHHAGANNAAVGEITTGGASPGPC